TTLPKSALSTPSISPVLLSSIRSNSVGNALQRLTQRRQPWQMLKIRSSSLSADARSKYAGFFQSLGCRVGASRLPSRWVIAGFQVRRVCACAVYKLLDRALWQDITRRRKLEEL